MLTGRRTGCRPGCRDRVQRLSWSMPRCPAAGRPCFDVRIGMTFQHAPGPCATHETYYRPSQGAGGQTAGRYMLQPVRTVGGGCVELWCSWFSSAHRTTNTKLALPLA